MKPLISIIIPVYNAEKYLGQCLDSVLSQTVTDYEVILVDDESTDSSPQICAEYAKKDKRIVVVHQKNKGVSGARNTGIRQACGEWITFLDSDDWWEPRYLEYMDLTEADLCVCGYNVVYQDSSKITVRNLTKGIVAIADYVSRIEEYFGTVLNFPWGKLYRREIILQASLFNENVILGEDLLFNIEYYKRCRTVRLVEKPLVNYRQVSNSLSHRYYEKMFEYYELEYSNYINLLKIFGRYEDENKCSLLKKYWGNFVESVLGVSRTPKKLSEKKKIIVQKKESLLCQECIKLYRNGELQIENRMQNVCMRLIMNNHYYQWLWLIAVYEIRKYGGSICRK